MPCGMSISKKEKNALKFYINNIYSINGAVFLEVSNKSKVRKALSHRGFNFIVPVYDDIIVLPYNEGIRFNTLYSEFIENYINDNFRPTLKQDINSLIDVNEFKLFMLSMIVRKNLKYITIKNKSLLFLMSFLLKTIGIDNRINLKHMNTIVENHPVIHEEDISMMDITPKQYKQYGWIFKLEKLTVESPFYYDLYVADNYAIPLFKNIKYSKNENFISTPDNYQDLLSEYTGMHWLTKIYVSNNSKM